MLYSSTWAIELSRSQHQTTQDELSVPTLKKVFAPCGNECAYPGCTAPIVDDDSGIVVGEISHIKGKSPQGPRYDPNQTREERNGYENLLLMCNPHNKIIDHEDTRDKFPVNLLREFKTKHESKFRRSLTDKRDPSRIDFNLVNQNLMNNFVSHFLNVEGSVINSENKWGVRPHIKLPIITSDVTNQ